MNWISKQALRILRGCLDLNARFGGANDASDQGRDGCAMPFQDVKNSIQFLGRHAKQQAAARLGIRHQGFGRVGHSVPFHELIGKGKIVAAAPGNAVFGNEAEHLLAQDGKATGVDHRSDATGTAHGNEVTDKPEPRYIHCGSNQSFFREIGAGSVELNHHLDGFLFESGAGQTTFDRSCGDANPERLCQHEQISGPGRGVGEHVARGDQTGDRQSEYWFWVANGVAAHQHALRFFHFTGSASENRVNDGRRHQIRRDAHQVERGQWTAAHGIDIRKRICCRDLPINKRIVHDGREKIHRLDERPVTVDAINACVVRSRGSDEQVGISNERKPTQNLRQSLLA